MRVSSQRITARVRDAFYASVMRKRVAFFDRNKTGELVNRLSADSQLVSQTLTQQVSDGLRSAVMTAAGVGEVALHAFYVSQLSISPYFVKANFEEHLAHDVEVKLY